MAKPGRNAPSRRPKRAALKSSENPLAEVDDGLTPNLRRGSHELIHESIMRGGGEPFGEPLGIGTSTLTERIVAFFKQRSFFGFETYENKRKRRRNKFTRYGAANYRGSYRSRKR